MSNDYKFKEGDFVVLESEEHYEYVLQVMKDQGFMCTRYKWLYQYEGVGSILNIRNGYIYCEDAGCSCNSFKEEVFYPLLSEPSLNYWNGEGVPVVGEMLTINNYGNIYNCILEYYGEKLIVVKLLGYHESKEQHFYLSSITLSPCEEYLQKKARIVELEAELEELKAQI